MENLFNFIRVIGVPGFRRQRKIYRPRINPFRKYTDLEFVHIYRISKDLARQIIEIIRPDVRQILCNRGLPVPLEIQVLAFIRHCGKGKSADSYLIKLCIPT